jgi:5'(3')-deoxyribonucleotidase
LESINYDMMQMLATKLDDMINKLDTSNTLQDRLLKQSSI